jgi:hypothetical protein
MAVDQYSFGVEDPIKLGLTLKEAKFLGSLVKKSLSGIRHTAQFKGSLHKKLAEYTAELGSLANAPHVFVGEGDSCELCDESRAYYLHGEW